MYVFLIIQFFFCTSHNIEDVRIDAVDVDITFIYDYIC